MAALSSPRCLFNSQTALRRVFSLSTPAAPCRHLLASGHVLLLRASSPSQVRSYAGPPPRRVPRGQRSVDSADGGVASDDRGFSPLYTTAQDIERSQKDRMPQDYEIKDPKIMVLENGSIAGPLSSKYVMSKLDEKTESLRMIRPYVPKGAPLRKGAVAAGDQPPDSGGAGPATTTEEQYALCEIVNKHEAFLKEKERKERKKAAGAAKIKTKEMELTWSISEHDLQTKLRQLGAFLAKGMKVQLVLGTKKGSKKVDEDTMRALLRRIETETKELGARELAPAKGELGRTMRLNLEGVVKTQT
ncbi:Translation initiation factor 3 [Cordyceps militaris CM01]|uniref:Translation initiation factor 3 n=2 Tax=Cordyceps militaris TaxID=73501 RepID=G3JU93_CORMM|nr:Translation initiation factor 3 [Cordyceps militaris CM01]ATY59423.1 Translation initiation factor 3 [Cordyceps militaris]EGX87800.1 Translation initiation factor 3 [Cordyceps militaris CM01]